MTSPLFPRKITARLSRVGEAAPVDHGWLEAAPEERIGAVFELMQLCLAWNGEATMERDLARTSATCSRR